MSKTTDHRNTLHREISPSTRDFTMTTEIARTGPKSNRKKLWMNWRNAHFRLRSTGRAFARAGHLTGETQVLRNLVTGNQIMEKTPTPDSIRNTKNKNKWRRRSWWKNKKKKSKNAPSNPIESRRIKTRSSNREMKGVLRRFSNSLARGWIRKVRRLSTLTLLKRGWKSSQTNVYRRSRSRRV